MVAAVRTDTVIPFAVHRAQLDFLRSTALFRGYVGGRGAGKTTIGAYDLIKHTPRNRFVMAVAPDYPTVKDVTLPEFRKTCEMLGRRHSIRDTDYRGLFQTSDGGKASISFRSADDPDRLRGPNVCRMWMDEASLIKEEAYRIGIACLRDRGEMGRLTCTFTPKGKRHWTYQRFVEKATANHALFHCRSSDNPFLPTDYEELIAAQYTESRRRQELEGQFVDDDGQLISYDAMLAVSENCLWENGSPRAGARPELYIGVDIGRTRDLTCIWTWEKVGDVLWSRDIWTGRGVTFETQKAEIVKRIRNNGRVVKCQIDKGGIGFQLAEELERMFPRVVEGVHLTGGNMAAIANGLAVAVEGKRCRIPHDRDVHDDWAMIPKPETKHGKDTLAKVERDKELGHADRFWAAALGVDAAMHAPSPVSFGRPRGYAAGMGR